MSDAQLDTISAQIEQAHQLAERGLLDEATAAFALSRQMAVSLGDSAALARRIENNERVLVGEREEYRRLVADQRSADRRLLVIGDSLGLPRPDSKDGPLDGASDTYPAMLLEELPEHSVDSVCQRYFTTDHVVDLLREEPDLGADSDVVVHVGLNDCANRMFLERERIAINLLPEDVRDRIVGFAQKYRRVILRSLPPYHYVDPDSFRTNLDMVVGTLRARNAGRIALATIILPPIRFWPATPGLNRNFANYNLMIMDAVARHDAVLFDVDRHVWARQHEDVLLPDGMHLSTEGHRLFARELAALLR